MAGSSAGRWHSGRRARSKCRLRQYSLPREFARMQQAGFPGTMLAKTLIIHHEPSARITVILVPETLGF